MSEKPFTMPDARLEAPERMLRDVRARAAVAGMPPKMPEMKLTMPMERTSWRWSKSVFVMRSAMKAEMSVSRTATTAMELRGAGTSMFSKGGGLRSHHAMRTHRQPKMTSIHIVAGSFMTDEKSGMAMSDRSRSP